MKLMHCLIPAILGAGVLGCRTWAQVGEYEWTINVPAKVNRGEDLVFRVDARKDGAPAEGISFRWSVDWVSVRGMIHKGRAYETESIRAKGAAGTGLLRVYAYDPDGSLKQVAKAEFTVE